MSFEIADLHMEDWDKEARDVGRIAMLEHVVAALITQSQDVGAISASINMKLDMMTGRNPPAELTEATSQIAGGAAEVAKYLLKVCESVEKERNAPSAW